MFTLGVGVCVVCLGGAKIDPEVREVFDCHVHAFYVSFMCAGYDGGVVCERSYA